ncbi:MAG: host attachment protein [Hyphomonadaceae bacterium]
MHARKRWAVTFDGANCRVFAVHGRPARLEAIAFEVQTGDHKPVYARGPDIVYSSAGPGRSTITPRTDAERRLEAGFVEEIVRALETRMAAFDDLFVLAEPRALGAFRARASAALLEKVKKEISGNYANQSEAHLAAAIDGD